MEYERTTRDKPPQHYGTVVVVEIKELLFRRNF